MKQSTARKRTGNKNNKAGSRKKGNGRKKISKGRRRRQIVFRVLIVFCCLTAAWIAAWNLKQRRLAREKGAGTVPGEYEGKIPRPVLDVELLTVNEYSRPALALEKVKGVVIHYTANPGTSAMANRNYFEGLKDSHITKASSHFVIGLKGEIVQCIPCSEISYASNQRNQDTISIECCIEDDTGRFNKKTYKSVIHLTAWLAERYQLDVTDIIRHYDVTGKACPKYFVDHPDQWEQFLADVQAYLKRYGVL